MTQTEKPATSKRWSDSYPVAARDGLQKVVDPIVDNRVFGGAIFALIIYSMYNLYMSYQAETPVDAENLKQISFWISTIFMIEFLLKLLSRRWAYFKKEGIVDFLAASDFFSPAIRATKFVRFLRVLRILRVIRGVRMIHHASRIEDSLFTTFSTATIVVMLVFTSVKSHYDWITAKDRVQERMIPVLDGIEENFAETDAGKFCITDQYEKSVDLLTGNSDFIHAQHYTPGGETDWSLATKREVAPDKLRSAVQGLQFILDEKKADLTLSEIAFLDDSIITPLGTMPSPAVFQSIRHAIYLERQRTEDGAFKQVLAAFYDTLSPESVPIYLSQILPKDLGDYMLELQEKYFEDEFLVIDRPLGQGHMVYLFLIDDEYRAARADELQMLLATFLLIMVMMGVLSISVRDIITPLGELRKATADMAAQDNLLPVKLSRHPDNEITEIADNLNRLSKIEDSEA